MLSGEAWRAFRSLCQRGGTLSRALTPLRFSYAPCAMKLADDWPGRPGRPADVSST